MKRRLNVRTIEKKIDENGRHNLFKYEAEYFWKKKRDVADYLAQKYPKLLAFKDKKLVRCLTCDKMMTWDDCNGCHWIEKGSSGSYWCRWKEWNIYPCCEKCNNWDKERHTRRLTEHVTKLFGPEQVSMRQAEDWKVHSRPQWYEVLEVIEKYKDLIKKV